MKRCIICKKTLTDVEFKYYDTHCESCAEFYEWYMRSDRYYPYWVVKIICIVKRLFRR